MMGERILVLALPAQHPDKTALIFKIRAQTAHRLAGM